MSEFYRMRQKRVWTVDFELSARVRVGDRRAVRRVLLLRKEHVGWMTPGCGVVTEQDVTLRKYLVIDEYADDLIDHIVSEPEGEKVMTELRSVIRKNPLAQAKDRESF